MRLFILSQLDFLLGIFLIIHLILITLFITAKITKIFFKFFIRIILNSILGVIALFLLNFVGVTIPIVTSVLIAVALFGLPALATILILLFFGVKIG